MEIDIKTLLALPLARFTAEALDFGGSNTDVVVQKEPDMQVRQP